MYMIGLRSALLLFCDNIRIVNLNYTYTHTHMTLFNVSFLYIVCMCELVERRGGAAASAASSSAVYPNELAACFELLCIV